MVESLGGDVPDASWDAGRGGPPGRDPARWPESAMRRAWLFRVLDAALAVPALADDRSRGMVLQLLRPDIATSVQRHQVPRFDLWAILRTCSNHPDGLAELLEVVSAFERDSVSMRRLSEAVAEQPRPDVPPATSPLTPRAADSPPTSGWPPAPSTGPPAVWGDVPARNRNFTGRVDLLQLIHEQLALRPTALLPQTLCGLGGVGKTQLAIEYSWRFASSYDLVWWVPAEQPAAIRSSLAALAALLGLPPAEDMDTTLRAVRDALRTGHPHRRWLVVFDNVDRPADLDWFLATSGGHILITSRNRAWSGVTETVEVDVFSRPESMELVRRRLPDISPQDADRLADRLGDLPLALEQAAVWMFATATPLADYLRLLDTQTGRLLSEGQSGGYPLPVAATWGLAADRLGEQAPAAMQLLELCSFLGSEPISLRLLSMGRRAALPAPLNTAVQDEIALRRAVRDVGRCGLARVDPARNSIELHRLVKAVLRDRLDPGRRLIYQRAVRELLTAADPGDPIGDPSRWPEHAELTPHVLAADLIHGAAPGSRDVVLHQVAYLWAIGDNKSSRLLAGRAYQDWAQRLGPDHEQTLLMGQRLGNVLRSIGRIDDARDLNAEIWGRTRRRFGDSHRHTLTIANSVGADLRLQGRWRQARALDEDLLAQHRQLLGADDPATLNSANNLAVDLRLLCDFDRARRLDEQTCEQRRRVLGPDHPLTLYGLSKLSCDHHGLGDYQTALALQRRSLPAHRDKLGPDHSDVIRASRAHALTLRSLGSYAEAAEISEELVARSRRVLGDHHPDTLAALTSLANSRALADRPAEARAAGEDALARYRIVLGPDNPFTLVAATNLATILRSAGDSATARSLDEAALAGFRAALGEDHPFTCYCTVNLALDAALRGDPAATLGVARAAVGRLTLVLSPGHPCLLACTGNLAVVLRGASDLDTARRLADEAVTGLRKALGHSHPETLLAEAGQPNPIYLKPDSP
jgi:hypothetical protein